LLKRPESELRTVNAWRAEPLPETAYDSEPAFFADTMTFYQWLQFVLLPRVRAIIEERGVFPPESSVGAYAMRELDGNDDAAGLVTALCEFDRFIDEGTSKSQPTSPLKVGYRESLLRIRHLQPIVWAGERNRCE
jgi:uncharacterized protein YqcC (DUF446 family)